MALTPEQIAELTEEERDMYYLMEGEEEVSKILGCKCKYCKEEYELKMMGLI